MLFSHFQKCWGILASKLKHSYWILMMRIGDCATHSTVPDNVHCEGGHLKPGFNPLRRCNTRVLPSRARVLFAAPFAAFHSHDTHTFSHHSLYLPSIFISFTHFSLSGFSTACISSLCFPNARLLGSNFWNHSMRGISNLLSACKCHGKPLILICKAFIIWQVVQ